MDLCAWMCIEEWIDRLVYVDNWIGGLDSCVCIWIAGFDTYTGDLVWCSWSYMMACFRGLKRAALSHTERLATRPSSMAVWVLPPAWLRPSVRGEGHTHSSTCSTSPWWAGTTSPWPWPGGHLGAFGWPAVGPCLFRLPRSGSSERSMR